VTLFDTAVVYGPFDNEKLVGEAIAPVRGHVVIASKFGFAYDDQGRQAALSSELAHVRAPSRGSLRWMRAAHIDLLYQHRFDPQVPIADVAGTVAELVAAGKVAHCGLSETGADTSASARGVTSRCAAE
jgi:aryl-alcohol dehydrogenase-like predicted oxidoreductase